MNCSGKAPGLVGLVLWGWAVSAAAGQELHVSASRLVSQNETVQAARQLLEVALRKDALRQSPTIVEWDRDLRDDVYRETVKEMAAGRVRLQSVKETLEVVGGGAIKLTLEATAYVDDEEAKKWAAGLDETERLRAELADARRREALRASSGRGSKSGVADDVGQPVVSTGVRMRLGDGADLGALAEAQSRATEEATREALIDMLRSAAVEIANVEATKEPGSRWTAFTYAVTWKLDGFESVARAYDRRVTFKGDDSRSTMRYLERAKASATGARLADELLWTRIDLEIAAGAGRTTVPVAFPAYKVGLIGEAACLDTYGRDYARRLNASPDMGWCIAVRAEAAGASERRAPDVRGSSKMWVHDRDLAGMTGPVVTWTVRWADGSVQQVAPVVRWAPRLASAHR